MQTELFAIAEKLGVTCDTCQEVCCINMALTIDREDVKRMAKELDIPAYDFRKKYTIMMKNWLKDAEWKGMSEEGKRILQQNPRLLKFQNHPIEEVNLQESQRKRLEDMKKEQKKYKDREQTIMVCPFYHIDTHRCIVHKARPLSCRDYPFNVSGEYIDLRKINACKISTKILERFWKFAKQMGIAEKAKPVKDALDSGEYHNHYYLPPILFFTYIVWECTRLNIPIRSPEIKKTEKMMATYGMMKEQEEKEHHDKK